MEEEYVLYESKLVPINVKYLDLTQKDVSMRGLHFHKEIELVEVLKGSILCEANDNKFTLFENQVLLINSFCKHKLSQIDENTKIRYMQVNISDYINLSSNQPINNIFTLLNNKSVKPYIISNSNDIPATVMNKGDILLQEKPSYYFFELKGYIYILIAYMYRNDFIFDSKNIAKSKQFSTYIPIIEYINKNISGKIKLEDLSSLVYVTKTGLCKGFKRATGKTVTEYINLKRVSLAKDLLLADDINISNIALNCGFSSIQYFDKIFKSIEGCTPNEYRNMYFS